MKYCNAVGHPPCDELERALRAAGGHPDDLPMHEYTRVRCELAGDHGGDDHAGYVDEINADTQLWIRWHGDRYAFPLLGPCPKQPGAGQDPPVCHLYAHHDSACTWEPDATTRD